MMRVRAAVIVALAIAWLVAPMARPGEAAALITNDFEDGTTQGWAPRGNVTLASVTEAAYTGTHSLKTTGRTATWNGPSLDLLGVLQADVVYQIRVAVRLAAGQPASTVKLTMERTVTGETSPNYDTVASSATDGVTDSAWVVLQGSYRFSGDVSALLLYVESSDATSEYYIDDVSIAELEIDQSGFTTDFEDGSLLGYVTQDGVSRYWSPRGSVTLANVTDDAHGGTHSLLTTGRTATWNGPTIDVLGKMTKGFRYRVTVWAKLAPGEDPTTLKVSVQRSLGDTTNYDNVTPSVTVTPDAWVSLSALYIVPADADAMYLYVESGSATASFYIDDVSLTFTPPPPIQTDIPSVRDVLAEDFLFGGAVEPNQLSDPLHAQLVLKHLNSLTAENAMKFGSIHPSEDTYNFAAADAIANFARNNGLTMRGHTLVWHSQNPDWLFKDADGNDLAPSPESKALMLQRLEDHIRTVVSRYADVVSSWDVANEVIDPSQPDGLRRSPWYELCGTDYIDRAFIVAREVAGPDAKLYINDYSTTDPARRQALLNLVQGMLDRGVPVDGVGHQMHINIEAPSVDSIRQTIQTFAALGLDNQITEMDVSIYTNSTDSYTTVPEDVLVRQGYRYRDVFRALRDLSADISSVTLWGLADDHTWLKSFPITRTDLPLLFDEQLQAKPAYWGVVDPSQLPVLIQTQDTPGGHVWIDGRADLRWRALPPAPITAEGAEGLPISGAFKALWSGDTLFVMVDVADRTIDWGDAIEVFVDENNDKSTTPGDDDAHYTFPRFRHWGYRHGTRSIVVPLLRGGYRLEAAIPLQAESSAGRQIGFDVRIRDGCSPGTLLSWNDTTNSQETDTSKYGVLRLTAPYDFAKAVWGRPKIDGVVDPIWAWALPITTDTWVQGSSGATATVKMMWDRGHLYVLAVVSDPLLSAVSSNPWEQDSVEIFVDQNNGKTSSYQSDDGQYRVNFENVQSYGGAASASNFVTATKIVPGGYIVEAAISLDSVDPLPGTLLGFDVQVNDDGLGDGVRSSVATWSDPTGQSYQDTSRLGVLELVLPPGFFWSAGRQH